MIGQLRGTIISKQPPDLLLDVGGVGYEVQLPMTSFYQLPEVGAEATVVTHFVVREDAQLLFGFCALHERAMFRELIKTNGVGPKLALAILSGMSAEQFAQVVHHGDITSLMKLPGVGKKTAERLLVEMKDRLKDWNTQPVDSAADGFALSGQVEDTFVRPVDATEDAVAALIALGYKPAQASRAVGKVAVEGMSSEALIRDALRNML
ncbi:Holliday junction branch migration protein RuvA [Corallincola holothuriorum]|uniref:Holliday junction branch migration complex subunit RuvA n=1 Tax=Corallincola holothuriorum TaxID=2282215 RepID=A0A368NI87_9GAMM|nr:Holliday junction branch migration protein RuvA [Corallincola holothuriorum]RCU49445.1 Holliday junction branch migration protein RuvA [Corallincola holothuriorum]